MRAGFLALAGSVVALYAAAFVVGLMVDAERFFVIHFAIGLCAIVFTLLTHCVVMTYLIISGKVVRLTVEERCLDPDFIIRTKEIKAQTFPFMVAAIVLLLAAAFFGAAATEKPTFATFHLIAALVAAGYNTFTFAIEDRTIRKSTELHDALFERRNGVDAPERKLPSVS